VRGAHAPIRFTDASARRQRAAKDAARSIPTIAATWCIISASFALSDSEHRTTDGSPGHSRRWPKGTARPESFIPPGLPFPEGDSMGKRKEMFVVVRQFHALDTRSPTLQRVAGHW
jgi:hypothetical protein